jgi:hypothetical protein
MAVPLIQSGEHRVLLRYRPQIVRTASIVTAATWVTVLVLSLIAVILGRRPRHG